MCAYALPTYIPTSHILSPALHCTPLQARMLRVMHGNMTNLATYHGAPSLARLTAAASNDLKRHELALLATCCQLGAEDPEGAVTALAAVVREGLMLPGSCMDDGWHQGNNAATAAAAAVAAAAGGSSGGSAASSSTGSSLLYQDWMAAADCLGVWCASDTAAAVQDLCGLLQVRSNEPLGGSAVGNSHCMRVCLCVCEGRGGAGEG